MSSFLPQSPEAEKGFLSSLFQRPALIEEYSDFPPGFLVNAANQDILVALREMVAANAGVGLVTLTQWMADRQILEKIGGAPYLSDLYTFVPTPAMHKDYAEILREKWIRRVILGMSRDFEEIALKETGDIEVLLGRCEESAIALRKKTEARTADPVQHCERYVIEALSRIEEVYKHRGRTLGLDTGLHDLNRMTSGLQGPRMYVFGGLPGSGKTSLLTQIVEFVATEQNAPSLVFSLEMGGNELMERSISREAGIDMQRLRDGFLQRSDNSKLVLAANKLVQAKIYIDPTPQLTTAQFRARCRAAKLQKGIKLVAIDYLQLQKGVSKAAQENRQQEIAEISGTIKAVAKELNIPIIVLAQLKRDVEDRKSAPKLSDLRESAAIGQDADLVMLLQPHAEPLRTEDGKYEYNTTAHIVKQRHGPVGSFHLNFDKKITKFSNLTEKQYSNNLEERQH